MTHADSSDSTEETTEVTALQPGATGRAMKQRHPLLVWLVWPICTLGIYFFVWYYKIHKEMAEFDRRRHSPVIGPMLVMLLLSWTIIGALVSYWRTGARIRQAQHVAGVTPTCQPLVCLLLSFLFGVNALYMQMQLNKIVVHCDAREGEEVALAN